MSYIQFDNFLKLRIKDSIVHVLSVARQSLHVKGYSEHRRHTYITF